MHVRLWDGPKVKTKHIGSEFMGHSTAQDHWWVENVNVSERGLLFWPHVKHQDKTVRWRGELPNPNVESFEEVKIRCADPVFTVKVGIFNSIAREINTFLTMYQAVHPMLPFLSEDMHKLFKGCDEVITCDEVVHQCGGDAEDAHQQVADSQVEDEEVGDGVHAAVSQHDEAHQDISHHAQQKDEEVGQDVAGGDVQRVRVVREVLMDPGGASMVLLDCHC
ncbi:hypothetical protein N1851_029214 [Merluccius polli]|uniref:Uncharacterized protein n=1 Tax=Merluccius polli TaxID=89951 RepID=A0AA47M7D8_MERPO|nr:hypothetical protein N1851_029214 [Merluccius polli]